MTLHVTCQSGGHKLCFPARCIVEIGIAKDNEKFNALFARKLDIILFDRQTVLTDDVGLDVDKAYSIHWKSTSQIVALSIALKIPGF